MPTMWLVHDGRTAYTDAGPGEPLSFDEATALFATEDIRYLGPQPASIGVDREPSEDPNVVVELADGGGTNVLLPMAGYYWVTSVDAETVRDRLAHQRRH
jgi:hypothetical protein